MIISRARLDDISYHSLARLPVGAIRAIVDRAQSVLRDPDPVMHIRPQSVATALDVEDALPIGAIDQSRELSPDAILALSIFCRGPSTLAAALDCRRHLWARANRAGKPACAWHGYGLADHTW